MFFKEQIIKRQGGAFPVPELQPSFLKVTKNPFSGLELGKKKLASAKRGSKEKLPITPQEFKQTLKIHYSSNLSIKRLFYPNHPIPIGNHYICLSILPGTNYQSQLTESMKKKEGDNVYEISTQLYGHGAGLITPDALMPIFAKSAPCQILVLGTAGIGKSTLSERLCYLWAMNGGRLSNEYTWVFRIPLRNLNAEHYPNKNYSIVDVIEQECLSLAGCEPLTAAEKNLLGDALFKAAEKREVLLILDGLDELNEEIPAVLVPILRRFMSSEQSILTSRPYNLSELKEEHTFHSHHIYEITGFAEPHIKKYVTDFFQFLPESRPEEAEQVLAFLEQNRNIAGICRVPINLELFCSAWAKSKIPQGYYSITAIYEAVTRALCLRYLEREGSRKKVRGMDDALIREKCTSPLAFLEHFGYQSVSTNKLFLNVSPSCQYLRNHNQSLNDNNFLLEQKAFGFIRSSNPKSEYDSASHYYFNHLTFRDYFAARFLIQCFQASHPLLDKQAYLFSHTWQSSDGLLLEEFLSEKRFDLHYEFIWWFMAGILATQRDILALKKLLSVFLTVDDKAEVSRFLLLVRCLDEASELNDELPQKLWGYIEEWFQYIFHPFFNLTLLHNQSMIVSTLRISPSIFFSHNIQSFFCEKIPKSDVFALKQFIDFFCKIGLPLSGHLEETLLERLLRLTIVMDYNELRFWQILIQGVGLLYKKNLLSLFLLKQKYQDFHVSSEESTLISAIFLCAEASPEDKIEPSVFRQEMYQTLIDIKKPFHQRIAAASMLANYYEVVVYLLLKQKEGNAYYLSWDIRHFLMWDNFQKSVNILTEPIMNKLQEAPVVDFELRVLLYRLGINYNFAPFFEPFIFKKDNLLGDKLIAFLCWICSLKTASTSNDLLSLNLILEEIERLLRNPKLELEKITFSEFLAQLFSPDVPMVFTTFVEIRTRLTSLFLNCFNEIAAPTIKKYLAIILACHVSISYQQCPMVFNAVICNSYSQEEFIKLSPKLLTLAPAPMLANELSFCRQDCTAFLSQLTLDHTTDSHSLFLLLNKTPTRAVLKFAVEEVIDSNEIGFCHLMAALILRYLLVGKEFYLNEEGICYFGHHKYQVFSLDSDKRKKVEQSINSAKANLKLPELPYAVIEQLSSALVSAKLKSKEKKARNKKSQYEEIKQTVNINVNQNQTVEKDNKNTTIISRSAVAYGENSSVQCNAGSGGKSVFHITDGQRRTKASVNLPIRGDEDMAVGFSDIVTIIEITKAVYDQAQKARHLKSLASNLGERAASIEKILGNADLRKKIEQSPDAGLERALEIIWKTLQEGVQPYLAALTEEGKVAKAKIFLQAGSYTERYERLTGILDGGIHTLNMALGIETGLTVDKIAEENKVIQKELEEASEFLASIEKEAKKQGEGLSGLKDYLENLNAGIEKLHGELQKLSSEQLALSKIDREFYYQSAVSDVKNGMAIKGISLNNIRSVEDINILQQGVPVGQKSVIESAVANKKGGIAVALPMENNQATQAVLRFIQGHFSSGSQRQQSPSRIAPKATVFTSSTHCKKESVEGISCEKDEKGYFRVIINYDELGLTSEEEKDLQKTLTGRYGKESRGHRHVQKEQNAIIMDELSEGCIKELLFKDENSAKILVDALNSKVGELRQQSPQRGASPVPKA